MKTTLYEFIRESNHIEGLDYIQPSTQLELYNTVLDSDCLSVPIITTFVKGLTPPGELRDRQGMDVRVGNHYPPPGGAMMAARLRSILDQINAETLSPYNAHQQYEDLHPYTDGNGRSGRIIWLWQIKRRTGALYSFLHMWYYQSLGAGRGVPEL